MSYNDFSTILQLKYTELFSFGILTIYDMNNIRVTCKELDSFIKENYKKITDQLVQTNLVYIFKKVIKVDNYDSFILFCSRIGGVLGGSIILKALTGLTKQWGQNPVDPTLEQLYQYHIQNL